MPVFDSQLRQRFFWQILSCRCSFRPIRFFNTTLQQGGTQWRSWLRHCASSWKFACSIPASVIGIIHSSGRTRALGYTQPITKMSIRDIQGRKVGRWVRLTTLSLSCADCLEIWDPQPPGNLRASTGIVFPFHCLLTLQQATIYSSTVFYFIKRRHFLRSRDDPTSAVIQKSLHRTLSHSDGAVGAHSTEMVRPQVTAAVPLEFGMCVVRILAGFIDYAVLWSFTVALADSKTEGNWIMSQSCPCHFHQHHHHHHHHHHQPSPVWPR